MSLDDKLREILDGHERGVLGSYEVSHEPNPLTPGEAIEQIKQAFTDDGYSSPVDKNGIINFGTEEQPILIHKDSLPFSPNSGGGYIDLGDIQLMTGQEWYDAFRKEFRALAPKSYAKDFYAKKAAQNAAGLVGPS